MGPSVTPTPQLPWTLVQSCPPGRLTERPGEPRNRWGTLGSFGGHWDLPGDIGIFPMLSLCRRDGGASCVGPARSHRTCHTEVKSACPSPSLSPSPFSLPNSSRPAFGLPITEGEQEASPGTGVVGTESQDPRAPGHRGWIRENLNLPSAHLTPMFSCRAAQTACGTSGRSSVQNSMAPTSRVGATGGCPTTQVSSAAALLWRHC